MIIHVDFYQACCTDLHTTDESERELRGLQWTGPKRLTRGAALQDELIHNRRHHPDETAQTGPQSGGPQTTKGATA